MVVPLWVPEGRPANVWRYCRFVVAIQSSIFVSSTAIGNAPDAST
jgi:hypothetical protein